MQYKIVARGLARAGLAATLALSVAAPAQADVLTFDDLSGIGFFTSDYNGFRFGDNSLATNPWFYTDNSTPFYAPQSSPTFISTDFQLYQGAGSYVPTLPISRATAFVFDGAFFSGGDSIGYQLLLNNVVVFTSAPSAALTSTPTFIASGYAGLVDQVVIFGNQGFFALDDFTYNSAVVPAPVPEPGTWMMMILGFGAVGGAIRYRRREVAASLG